MSGQHAWGVSTTVFCCTRLLYVWLVLFVPFCVGCELLPQFISSPILTASAVSDNTIDIHVSVTINTMNGGRFVPPPPTSVSSVLPLPVTLPASSSSPLPAVLYPVPSLSGGACTLADLKKQRSLYRVGVFESIDSPNSTTRLKSNVSSSSFIFPSAELTSSGNVSNGNSSASNTWSSSTKRGDYALNRRSSLIHLHCFLPLSLQNYRLTTRVLQIPVKRRLYQSIKEKPQSWWGKRTIPRRAARCPKFSVQRASHYQTIVLT